MPNLPDSKKIGVPVALVVLILIGFIAQPLVSRHRMIVEEQSAIRRLQSRSPELLLKACREIIANQRSFKSHPVGLQSALAPDVIWLNASNPTWPDGVPQEIVGLRPRSVMIGRKHVEILLTRGRRAIGLWAFAEGDSGNGSIRLADGLWIARRADGWGKQFSSKNEQKKEQGPYRDVETNRLLGSR